MSSEIILLMIFYRMEILLIMGWFGQKSVFYTMQKQKFVIDQNYYNSQLGWTNFYCNSVFKRKYNLN